MLEPLGVLSGGKTRRNISRALMTEKDTLWDLNLFHKERPEKHKKQPNKIVQNSLNKLSYTIMTSWSQTLGNQTRIATRYRLSLSLRYLMSHVNLGRTLWIGL